ncbi:extracellular protein [Colletotrichum musicola]|uniref:Extracellular protein n=1 Tax=Colletotrichum musicola TaxID=2175873 RepID=A0A8H6JZD7_9PEZI|nr:extracellular protein [Colletotrichum musicola]
MKAISFLSAVALLASQTTAHMAMTYPPPLRSKLNPFSSNIDYSITSPMAASGSDFPCKGTLNLLGTKDASPVATWQAGREYNMSIDGGANHNGGSCQAALSFDKGKTFTVIHSYIGNCPVAGASSLKFTLPADTPSAPDAIFAWTWFNNVGNREFYMNCAIITVNGGGGGQTGAASSFSSRPEIFKANINNGCSTLEGSDVMFPNPGPDVTSQSSKTAPPSGNTGTGGGSGAGSGSGSGGASPAPSSNPVPSNPAPVASSPAAAPSSPVAPVSSQVASQPATPPATSLQQYEQVLTPPRPGGVFIPVPSASSSCDSETKQQTTMVTVNRPSNGSPTTAPAATSVNPSVPTPTLTPPENAQNAMTPGLACTDEGQWLCVQGTHFQRCASGQWSVMMSMAAGTKCVSGSTEFVTWAKKRSHKRAHSRRYRSKHI